MDMKELRERLGLRTVDIASKLGVGNSTVRGWESGRYSPTLPVEQIPLMLEVYQCSLQELIAASQKSKAKQTNES